MRSFSPSKVSRPHVKGALLRPRVFDILDLRKDCGIVWISAPAGSGKTTLVASYLTERNLNALWYQVDERDCEIATFFYYMGIAAQKGAFRKKTVLPLLTPEYLLGIPQFTFRYFENLYGSFRMPSVIVLDNYQMVPENSEFHDRMCQGFSIVPEGINIFVLSRLAPPPQFARLTANGDIRVIDNDSVKFSRSESEALFSLVYRGTTPGSLSDRLYDKTRGWAAGLVLLANSEQKEKCGEPDQAFSASDDVFRYFATEIFGKTDLETQDFLLKTAFFSAMTVSMAEELTMNAKTYDILSRLVRDNFFTHRDIRNVPSYQYHPLFRAFLLARAKAGMPEDVLREVQKKAAFILENSGRIEDACDLLRDASDLLELTRLILAHAPVLFSQGRGKTIEVLLAVFPAEVIERDPWLCYWNGVCKKMYDPPAALENFTRAFEMFEAQDDIAGALISWASAVDTSLSTLDVSEVLDRWMEWIDRYMERFPGFPSPEIEARVLSNLAVAIMWRQPYKHDVETLINHALALSLEINDSNLCLQNCGSAMILYAWKGDLHKSASILAKVKSMALTRSASPLFLIFWKTGEAIYYQANSSSDPLLPVQQAIEIGRASGVHVIEQYLMGIGVYSSFCVGNMKEAEKWLQEMWTTARTDRKDQLAHYHFLWGWYHFIRGEISQAALHLERCVEFSKTLGALVPEIIHRHLGAHILNAGGEHDKALLELNAIRKLTGISGFSFFEYLLHLTEAEFELDRGNEAAAVQALYAAMTLGRKQGLITALFVWRPEVMVRLCAKALEYGIESDHVKNLVRGLKLNQGTIPLDVTDWPWPVEIRTFGRFELLRDGAAVSFSRKVQKRPLSLLKALIAFGGKEVRQHAIEDLLWPDADGDMASSAFKTTLSRLRKLLGTDKAIEARDGKVSIDSRLVWVDTRVLENLGDNVAALQAKPKDARIADAERLSSRVLKLYQGEFLDGDDEPWIIPVRQKFRNRFLRIIQELGDTLDNAGKKEKLSFLYESVGDRGISADELRNRGRLRVIR